MAQPHKPPDPQGLLQSMLQRLRLQSGRDGQDPLHGPGPLTAAAGHPGNGFDFGTNGIQSKEFGPSAVGRDGETQRPSDGRETDRGLVSSPSQTVECDKDTGESRVLGGAASPRITPAGTGQAFPAPSDLTSFKETHTPQSQGPSFKPKVYAWSLRPSGADAGAGGQVLHVGNGGFAASPQSSDAHFVASGLNTSTTTTTSTATNSKPRRKQRSSENTTRRWTQKIKERWLDRQGSFGRKAREQETEVSPQKQQTPPEGLGEASRAQEDEDLTPVSSDAAQTPGVDSSVDEGVRSSGDFEFGLGSFSLLEEIVTGQEWAKFLNPSLPPATANQRPPGEVQSPPRLHNAGQPSLILHQRRGGNHPWSVGGAESPPNPDFSGAAAAADASRSVSMDVLEERQQQFSGRAADQTEPMDEWQPGVGGQRRIQSCVERADILDGPTLRKVQPNRKRQHQPAHTDQGLHAGRPAPSLTGSPPSSHVMDETGESEQDVPMPPNPLRSPLPPPLSPFKPFAPVPRGALKHSISIDSEFSMETAFKRRRVEENRRVRFSEEVQLIDPPADLDMDATDSEEDSDDSVIEQEMGLEQTALEQPGAVGAAAAAAAESRWSTFPAWIKALKRKNTGRKHS